ncbi:DUF6326 family protein [Demequina mangrovi]|uniref:MFS transporter n=1 Tax=Demequina mangrovi TaxID=1043493 RepID=A0A1H6VXI6_9MICO|nr:DUF6326 family protein [Demequina mangrovi]SEJ09391.1 hypothetical protein SAMN05421637_0751 [Demequina mangrovi]
MNSTTATTDVPSATASAASARTAPHRQPRTLLSALWLFAILNYLYCDVIGFFDKDVIRDTLDGTGAMGDYGQGFLLGASVLMTIPISNVLIARIGSRGLARWASIVGGSVMTLVQVATLFVGSFTAYYGYFSALEIASTVAIVVIAWRWRAEA